MFISRKNRLIIPLIILSSFILCSCMGGGGITIGDDNTAKDTTGTGEAATGFEGASTLSSSKDYTLDHSLNTGIVGTAAKGVESTSGYNVSYGIISKLNKKP